MQQVIIGLDTSEMMSEMKLSGQSVTDYHIDEFDDEGVDIDDLEDIDEDDDDDDNEDDDDNDDESVLLILNSLLFEYDCFSICHCQFINLFTGLGFHS